MSQHTARRVFRLAVTGLALVQLVLFGASYIFLRAMDFPALNDAFFAFLARILGTSGATRAMLGTSLWLADAARVVIVTGPPTLLVWIGVQLAHYQAGHPGAPPAN